MPGWRAASTVSAWAVAGTMASVVMSPARPRSSSKAARTTGSSMSVGSDGMIMRGAPFADDAVVLEMLELAAGPGR